MIWRLTYCNKAGVEARLDIIKGASTPVEVVEGTATPFILNYKMDKPDKSGHVMSSSADISIFETSTFNIDDLKTSSETEIKVEYYVNSVLSWVGFVIPDFFSRQIGAPATVEMVASDRLGTLKGVTLSGLAETVKISALISQCLAKTGLSLSVNTKASFTSVAGSENVFESRVLSQRMIDMRGRRVSCYDILYSILVMTNSVVMQRHGEWWIANKIDWEAGGVLPAQQYHDFDDVSAGARRQIVPVASSVGVYHEFGGGRKYPSNHDFSIIEQTVPSVKFYEWTSFNSFVQAGNTLSVIGYSGETPIYGEPSIPMLKNTNESFNSFVNPDDQKYLMSTGIDIMSASSTSAQVNIEVSATGRNGSSFIVMVLADDGTNRYAMTRSGSFIAYDPVETQPVFLLFDTYDKAKGASDAVTRVSSYSGRLELENIDNYKIYIRIYGAGSGKTLFVNSASVTFAASVEIPSGNIYKTEQGDIYTKRHDTDTTIFGDYISGGLNGYFYNYMPDDVSSLMTSTGQPTTLWTTPADGEPLPLLQHVSRQQSRLFSVAHDMLHVEIDMESIDPLATFRDCSNKTYMLIEAKYDFLRSSASVVLEEKAYGSLEKKDYIYSYFGEGEEGISSVGGISGGAGAGGGTVGHTHPNKDIIDQLTQDDIDVLSRLSLQVIGTEMVQSVDEFGDPLFDENDDPIMEEVDIYGVEIAGTAYATEELSAYGYGGGGGGGGGGAIATLSDVHLTGLTSGNILKYNGTHWINASASAHSHAIGDVTGLQAALNGKQATLVSGTNIKTINGVSVLGSGDITVGGGGTTVAWGTETTGQSVQLTVAGTLKTLSLSAHTHSGVYEPVFSKNTAFNKNFGTSAGTVSEGNHTHANYVTLATTQTITGAKTFSAALEASVSVATPKVIFAPTGWSVEQSGTELHFKYNGTAKLKMLSDGTFEAVGEITAYA